MPDSVADLISQLRSDEWRSDVGFTAEIAEASERIWNADSDDQSEEVLNGWLTHFQPCLFGRTAAKNSLLSFCILSRSDLEKSDEHIAAKIQDARLRWLAEGFEGNKSGFVILAASQKIATAAPDEVAQKLARRLAFLYLQEDILANHPHLDEIQLRKHGQTEVIWRWDVGVNYFSAQGDKRWWQDHRIPAGLGFSMNSVGHMVKAANLAAGMRHLESLLDAPREEWEASKIDSLEKALVLAMRTIDNASQTDWGKATELLPLKDTTSTVPQCPFSLPKDLADKDFREYQGYYHTDFTIPSEYFDGAVGRSSGQASFQLDFTYLFHQDVDNPAHGTMGRGRRVRSDLPMSSDANEILGRLKQAKMWGKEVLLRDCDRLCRALASQKMESDTHATNVERPNPHSRLSE
jgi:hypothetical protein